MTVLVFNSINFYITLSCGTTLTTIPAPEPSFNFLATPAAVPSPLQSRTAAEPAAVHCFNIETTRTLAPATQL